MVEVAHYNVGERGEGGAAARHGRDRRGCMHDPLTTMAAVFRPHMDDHEQSDGITSSCSATFSPSRRRTPPHSPQAHAAGPMPFGQSEFAHRGAIRC